MKDREVKDREVKGLEETGLEETGREEMGREEMGREEMDREEMDREVKTGREEMGNECKVHQRQEPLSGNSFRINGFTGQGMKCQETKSPKMTDLELRGEETMQQKVPNSSMAIAKPSFR